MSTDRPILLPLHPAEVQPLLDALVHFAIECEKGGDPCAAAPHCDEVADRLRKLDDLANEWIYQLMRHHPMDPRYQYRPQG